MTDGYSGTVGTPEPILVPSRSPTRELSAALSGKALENAFVAGVYLLAYVALDWLSYVQPILKLGITPWNPQAGLTVALLLVRGPVWGVVAAAAPMLAEVVVRDTPAPPGVLLLASLWIGACYSGLAMILRRVGGSEDYRSVRAAAGLVLGAGGVSMLVAGGYVFLLVATGVLPGDSFWRGAAKYWVGDLNGILMVTPLLMTAPTWRRAWPTIRARLAECLAQALALLVTVWFVFDVAQAGVFRIFYLLFIPVIWIALRWGAVGATLGLLTIQVGILVAVQGVAPGVPLVDLQFLMVTLGLAGLMLGATVRERADALVRVATSEAQVQALLATAPDALVTGEPGGRILSANRVARTLFGLPRDGALGEARIDRLLPDLEIDATERRATLTARRTDGSEFPADVAWVNLESPAPRGWVVVIRDASERIDAEARRRERDSVFAKAMRFAVAGELSSVLAHELNQPITAMTSYLRAAQLLCESGGVEQQRLGETLAKSSREATRAASILRRLRDFYAGKAGELGHVSAGALLEAVQQSLAARCRAADVVLDIEVDPTVPEIRSDPMGLEIVLQNLVSNAIDILSEIRATRRQIGVRVQVEGDVVLFAVEDSGPGVPVEILPQLFEPLNTSKPDGMGLGLAICRTLMRAMGGDIAYRRGAWLGGARFEVRVPLRASLTDE